MIDLLMDSTSTLNVLQILRWKVRFLDPLHAFLTPRHTASFSRSGCIFNKRQSAILILPKREHTIIGIDISALTNGCSKEAGMRYDRYDFLRTSIELGQARLSPCSTSKTCESVQRA